MAKTAALWVVAFGVLLWRFPDFILQNVIFWGPIALVVLFFAGIGKMVENGKKITSHPSDPNRSEAPGDRVH